MCNEVNSHFKHVCIGVNFGDQLVYPPILEKHPSIHQLLPPFPPHFYVCTGNIFDKSLPVNVCPGFPFPSKQTFLHRSVKYFESI